MQHFYDHFKNNLDILNKRKFIFFLFIINFILYIFLMKLKAKNLNQ
jgi:hypothetical protein